VYDGSAENPVGTGPFAFGEWVRDDHLTVVRHESYWREGLPYLDEVEFRPLPDGETRAASLASGDIDMEHSNAASDLMAVGTDGSGAEDGFTAYFDGSGGEEMHVMLNGQSGPTADHDVRRALALATDREALVEGL
jgi:ABC-type transport system substrate-binding protein